MIRAFLLKEFRQHGLAFAALAALAALGLGLVVFVNERRGEAGSAFEILKLHCAIFGPLVAAILGNRLVVAEYQAKTQLFLEELPLGRARMAVTKFFLGLAFLALCAAPAWFASLVFAADTESHSPLALRIIAARAGAFLLFFYSLFFMMGLMGRYRAFIYIALFLGLVALDTASGFEPDRFGPFELLGPRFAFDREAAPTKAFVETLALSASFIALAFALACMREGSVAELLAERMTLREKTTLAAIALGFVIAINLYEERVVKAAFDLKQAISAEGTGPTVKIAVAGDDKDGRRQALANRAQIELGELQAYLGLASLPPTFIVGRRDLDARRYTLGDLESAEGVLARANYRAADWDADDFLAWLVSEMMSAASRGRAELESRRWVKDGVGLFWSYRDLPADDPANERITLRALRATQDGISRADLANWLTYRDRVGGDLAAAVACSLLREIERRAGREAMAPFLAKSMALGAPRDVRATLGDPRDPPAAALREILRLDMDQVFREWSAGLESERKRLASRVGGVGMIDGQIEIARLSDETRRVGHRVKLEPPPPVGASRYRFLYAELPPFDDEIEPSDIRSEDADYYLAPYGELGETFPRGTRICYTFAMDDPDLGCAVISGWRRIELD